jgi:hypothetical protein
MNERIQILKQLDEERVNVVPPEIDRKRFEGLTVDFCETDFSAEVVHADVKSGSLNKSIGAVVEFAKAAGLDIEWKMYGHDLPEIPSALLSFGFKEAPLEKVMIRCLTDYCEKGPIYGQNEKIEFKRVIRQDELRDLQKITEEVHGRSVDPKLGLWSKILRDHPETVSIYLAYVNSEPASSGRAHFFKGSSFCGLYGGQTIERFRNRGLFSGIVHARLVEGRERSCKYGIVDALPTSEPILRKLGFEVLTTTRPYVLEKGCGSAR